MPRAPRSKQARRLPSCRRCGGRRFASAADPAAIKSIAKPPPTQARAGSGCHPIARHLAVAVEHRALVQHQVGRLERAAGARAGEQFDALARRDIAGDRAGHGDALGGDPGVDDRAFRQDQVFARDFALDFALDAGRRAEGQFTDNFGSSSDARLVTASFIRHYRELSTAGTEFATMMLPQAGEVKRMVEVAPLGCRILSTSRERCWRKKTEGRDCSRPSCRLHLHPASPTCQRYPGGLSSPKPTSPPPEATPTPDRAAAPTHPTLAHHMPELPPPASTQTTPEVKPPSHLSLR